MADLWRDFWIRETGTGQQVAQLHDRYMMIIHLLKSPKYFEHYPAHLQEVHVVTVYMQPLVSSLSAGDCLVHRLRKLKIKPRWYTVNQSSTVYYVWKTALHVSDGTSTHHQERKNCIYSIWYLSHRYCYLSLLWKSWNWSSNLIRGTISRSFWFSYILFIIIIRGILVLFIYITRLASNEIFSPSNKILITTSILITIL